MKTPPFTRVKFDMCLLILMSLHRNSVSAHVYINFYKVMLFMMMTINVWSFVSIMICVCVCVCVSIDKYYNTMKMVVMEKETKRVKILRFLCINS